MRLHDDNLRWGRPARTTGTGALVLAGSSGRIDEARVAFLAQHGVTALGLRWFGGPGQPAVPLEIPVEQFMWALGLLEDECDHLAVIGLSYGAEAALLTAVHDPLLSVAVAIAPTDVAWEGQASHDEDPHLSRWTVGGEPVPFVPIDRTWEPPPGRPAFVDLYERSRRVAGVEAVEAATIPAERFLGELVLVAGGDDQVWGSADAARRIEHRRRAAGLPTTVVVDERAGHPVVLPGEAVPDLERPYLVGGDEGAPQRLGRLAWPAIASALGIAS